MILKHISEQNKRNEKDKVLDKTTTEILYLA